MLLNKLFLLLCVLALLATGCGGVAVNEIVWQDPAVDLSWPLPPDQPRVRFLRSLTGPSDFKTKGKVESSWRWLLGEVDEDLPLLTPFAIASADGVVWVADSGARMLYRIDLSQKKVNYIRELDGQLLTLPSGVAVDTVRGRVFLADAALSYVYVLDLQGELIDKWQPPLGFLRPAGMTISPSGELFVCDAMGGSVVVFNREGQVVSQVHSRVAHDGKFMRPLSVGIGPSGEVVVLDALAFRVEVQDRHGALLAEFGKVGDSAGSFARPKGLSVDSEGNIFVTDAAFDNIQVFDMTGNLLMYWGETGSQGGQFNLPAGLFVDQQGRLFAADSYNRRVQVFQILSGAQ